MHVGGGWWGLGGGGRGGGLLVVGWWCVGDINYINTQCIILHKYAITILQYWFQ